jgi:hypothetical protein
LDPTKISRYAVVYIHYISWTRTKPSNESCNLAVMDGDSRMDGAYRYTNNLIPRKQGMGLAIGGQN